MNQIAGKTVIVTGASHGAGREIARRLATEGASITLLARGQADLAQAVQEIRSAGGRCLSFSCNVADPEAVGEAVRKTEHEFGGIDGLINNAGIGASGPVEQLSLDDWNSVISTDLTGPFVCSQAVIPALRRRGGGFIISIGSGAGKQGYAGMAAYCAAKFGLHGLMQSLAQEVSDNNIKVSIINPGTIQTGFGSSSGKKLLPEDVADAVVHLLRQSDRAWTQEMDLWPFS